MKISVHYTDHTESNEYHMTADNYNIQYDNNNIDSEEQGFRKVNKYITIESLL